MPQPNMICPFYSVLEKRLLCQLHLCMKNRNRANKSHLNMGNQNPTCMPHFVREKANMISTKDSLFQQGRGNRNRKVTSLTINWINRENWAIQNDQNPRGNTRNIGTYYREIPLSSLPSFQFCVHILFFLFVWKPRLPSTGAFFFYPIYQNCSLGKNFIFEIASEQHTS